MINIVIPMAGAGSRFSKQGYTIPKPFIAFQGHMMIEHVLKGVHIPDATYTLIIQEKFQTEYPEELKKLEQYFNVKYVVVEKLTQGAACTALAAYRFINTNQPVLFVDSDTLFDPSDIVAFIADAHMRHLDGSLITIHSTLPSYSYVELEENGSVKSVREKEVVSDQAVAGVYYFASGNAFVDSAFETLIYGEVQKGEYYMSSVYNRAIYKGLKIGSYAIPGESVSCVGTPEQLAAYNKNFEKKPPSHLLQ
jgi:dTDP-glucose pyrophosphorylase